MQINLPSALVDQLATGFRPLKLNKFKMPVFQCLRFTVTPGKLVVTGYDLDQGFIHTSALATDQTAELLVPFEMLNEAAKLGDDSDVVLLNEGDKWTLTYLTAGVKITLVIRAPDVAEFPVVPEFSAQGQPLPAGFIRTLMEALCVASTDTTRFLLNSVHVSPTHVVATNGRQLYASNSLALKLPESGLILRSTDAWKVFAADEAAELFLHLSEAEVPTHVAIAQGPWRWMAKLIEGKYSNWQQVVPKEADYGTGIVFSPEDAARLQRVLPKLPGHHDKDSPVTLRVKDGFAGLQAGKPGAEVNVDLPGTAVHGDAVACRFNREFLVTALAQGFRELRVRDNRCVLLMRDGPRVHLWMPLRDDSLDPAAPAAVPNVSETQPASADSPTKPSNETSAPPMTHPDPTTPASPDAGTPPALPASRLQAAATVPATSTPVTFETALEQLQQAREAVRALGGTLAVLVPTLKDLARDHKSLERDHEALRKSVRSLREIEV
jgi:hypothetical protein